MRQLEMASEGDVSENRRLVRKALTEEEWNEIGEGIDFDDLRDIKFLVQCIVDVMGDSDMSVKEAFKELAPPPKSPGHELFGHILADMPSETDAFDEFLNTASFDDVMLLVTRMIKAKMPEAVGISVVTRRTTDGAIFGWS
jgi:hypothetical protein